MMRIPLTVSALSLEACWDLARANAHKLMIEHGYQEATIKMGTTAVIPAFHSETFPRLTVYRDANFQPLFTMPLTIELDVKAVVVAAP